MRAKRPAKRSRRSPERDGNERGGDDKQSRAARLGVTKREPGQRRALSHVGGAISVQGGTPEEQAVLRHALDVEPDDSETQAHIHGFHSYPARLHPHTARRLVEGFSDPGQLVLDPFCGSGTVVIEARLAGRRGYGSDLNPLAVELASFKSMLVAADRSGWLRVAEDAAAFATERREKKAGPLRKYGKEDLALFDIHVLLELDSLHSVIGRVKSRGTRRALALSLSAILTKVSRKAGDSAQRMETKRIAAGYTTKLFTRKVAELVERAEAFVALLPPKAYAARVFECDARHLDPIHDASADLVVTSPPYAGVFDYTEHHAARLRWLGLNDAGIVARELGARRHLDPLGPDAARNKWEGQLRATLRELRKKLKPEGRAVLVLADSVAAGRAVYAEPLIQAAVTSAGLELRASAGQPRPHFHRPTAQAFRRKERKEHAFLLTATPR